MHVNIVLIKWKINDIAKQYRYTIIEPYLITDKIVCVYRSMLIVNFHAYNYREIFV